MSEPAISNAAIREAVLDSLPSRETVTYDSIEQLRYGLNLARFSNKQVRRSIEWLQHNRVIKVQRPRSKHGTTRGWRIHMPVK